MTNLIEAHEKPIGSNGWKKVTNHKTIIEKSSWIGLLMERSVCCALLLLGYSLTFYAALLIMNHEYRLSNILEQRRISEQRSLDNLQKQIDLSHHWLEQSKIIMGELIDETVARPILAEFNTEFQRAKRRSKASIQGSGRSSRDWGTTATGIKG